MAASFQSRLVGGACPDPMVEVRPWKNLLPAIASLDNAYRPRKGEEDRIPHSFVFRKRQSRLAI